MILHSGYSFGAQNIALGARLEESTLASIASDIQPLPPAVYREGTQQPDLVPFSVVLTLTETEESGAFYLTTSSLVSENKAKLSKEIFKIVERILGGSEEQEKEKK